MKPCWPSVDFVGRVLVSLTVVGYCSYPILVWALVVYESQEICPFHLSYKFINMTLFIMFPYNFSIYNFLVMLPSSFLPLRICYLFFSCLICQVKLVYQFYWFLNETAFSFINYFLFLRFGTHWFPSWSLLHHFEKNLL